MTLKMYSTIQTQNGPLYNGDLANLEVKILNILPNQQVYISTRINQASLFYLCDVDFACYGDKIEGVVSIYDLISPTKSNKE